VLGVALVFRAMSMSIRMGLPGDGLEWAKRGQVQPEQVRIPSGGSSQQESGCRVAGQRCGRPHHCMVLIHLDCEAEPAFWVHVWRSSECHSCESHWDSTVEASAELDYNGFWVSVSRIINEILELVKVVVDCLLALEIGGLLQNINSGSFQIQRYEILSEFFFEVQPIKKVEMSGVRFVFEFTDRPVGVMAGQRQYTLQHHATLESRSEAEAEAEAGGVPLTPIPSRRCY